MADVSSDDVLKLAQLTRIALSNDEVEEFKNEFTEILKYVEQLKNVDITGLKPTYQVTGLTNVTRGDVAIDYGYMPSELLKNVPSIQDNQLKVKRMIG